MEGSSGTMSGRASGRSPDCAPSFNYASTIESVLKRFSQGSTHPLHDASILIVNADVGSQDGTPEIVKQTVGDLFPVALIQPLGEGIPPARLPSIGCPIQACLAARRPSDPSLRLPSGCKPRPVSSSTQMCDRSQRSGWLCSPSRCWRAVRTMWRPCSAAHDMREV